MKNIYITVALFFVLSVSLFIGAFVYLDKEKHSTYYYAINFDGKDIGTVKVERFVTEDKLLYKSSRNIPFHPMPENSKLRIVFDRNYNLYSYLCERFVNGASEIIYLENNKDNKMSFVATAQAGFRYLKDAPIKKGTFVFDEDSPVTYLALIENYNFRRGKSQGFNVITPFSPLLPPIKRFVTLTSIRDEYLKLDSRKIKAEELLLKTRNYPQGNIWVAKSDRSLLMMEIPERRLKITRVFSPKELTAKEYSITPEGYISKTITFKSRNSQLSGTMSIPKRQGRSPALLLIWGDGPQDRDYQGLFSSIADYLSREGVCVLRLDKRGVGMSEGDYSSTTDSGIIEDLKNALDYLASQEEVDPKKIAILGHAEGAFYASSLAAQKDIIKAFIMMAPRGFGEIDPEHGGAEQLKKMASKFKWSEDYLKTAISSYLETAAKIKNTKSNWISILGRRCFVGKIKERLAEDMTEFIAKVNIPTLILQNKEDEGLFADSIPLPDKAIESPDNLNHTLVYFGYLSHFFGNRVSDGIHRMRYETDKEVLQTVKNWLDKRFASEDVTDTHKN